MTRLPTSSPLHTPLRIVERLRRPDRSPAAPIEHRANLAEMNDALLDRSSTVFGVDQVEVGELDAFDYAILVVPTLRDALEFLGCHGSFLLRGADHGFDVADHRGTLWFQVPWGFHQTFRACSEHVLALYAHFLERAVGGRTVALEVTYQHERSASESDLRRFFGAPVHLGAPRTSLTFGTADLQRATLRPDPVLADILTRRLVALKRAAAPADIVEGTRATLARLLSEGRPISLLATSQEQGVSSRTLQRRLRDAGTSFQEVSDEVRRDLALGLLGDGSMTSTEIAHRLGFSSLEAFRSATKRWTGRPPSAFRREQP